MIERRDQRLGRGRRARGGAARRRWPVGLEGLEARSLLSTNVVLTAAPVVDVNKMPGNQSEEAIAINPTNPQNIIILSNQNAAVPKQNGALPVMESVTFDGGQTWHATNLGDGYGSLVPAFGDPSLTFDRFGNLFISYLDSTKTLVAVSMSLDGGQTFTPLTTFESNPHSRNVADQPTIVTGPGGSGGPGSVWLLFEDRSANMAAVGAPVYGKGLVGHFHLEEQVPESNNANFGDIAVGPAGQVIVTYQVPISDEGPSTIWTNVDPDGLGPTGFGNRQEVPPYNTTNLLPYKTSTTSVGGFDPIPAQPDRTIDAEAGLAYDRSGGPHTGRLYMVYTDASALRSPDTDIYVRYSDNNGKTWSIPVRVNDDNTHNSQFLPRIAVDQTTGNIGVSWYDARNDPGSGPGDRDGHPNDDVELYASVSTDGGASFSPNVQVAKSPSEAAVAGHNGQNDFGDYSGLAFQSGLLYPAWADNSVGLPGNPDPNNFDIATARVSVQYAIPITGQPGLLNLNLSGQINGAVSTNNPQPTFVGATEPGALVTLFVQPIGQTTMIPVGQTIAGPTGFWSIATIPLASGSYAVFAQATDLAGHTSPLTQLLPANGLGPLVVNTEGPRVTDLRFDPSHGQIALTFQDTLAGLDQASLLNSGNYALTKQGSGSGQAFAVTGISTIAPISPGAPQTVVLTINGGQRLRGVNYILRVLSGGIRDQSGNALDGEFFGIFPSGNGQSGGDFVARLDSIHHTVFPAQPVLPGDPPPVHSAAEPTRPRSARAPRLAPLTLAGSPAAIHDRALADLGRRHARFHRP